MPAYLRDLIDLSKAPLAQWEPVISEAPSAGKVEEDKIIYPAVTDALNAHGAQKITGIIADEARLELHIAQNVPTATAITHLTLTGAFNTAACHNVAEAKQDGQKVTVTTNIAHVYPHTQDAVVMSMILGCSAQAGFYDNIKTLIEYSALLLKEDGVLVLVRPNPDGDAFRTYSCETPVKELKAGGDYDFIVKGLEDIGIMKNLYTPDNFLQGYFAQAGLDMGKTQEVIDPASDPSAPSKPFLLNVCRFKR